MTSPTRPLVRLVEVGKRFPNGTLALERMNLSVGQHEFISFLGPSGCGKSTVLRLVAGLADPSSGEVVFDFERRQARGAERDLGFVFQEPTLMPWSTVFDNVYLPLRLAGRKRDEAGESVREALERVGLSRFAQVYPRELSGGMKMRVSIARALVTRPRLLLLDEPFAALDEMTRSRLNNDLLAIWRDHRFTVLFVTHSVYESVFLSSRIVVMAARPGRVVADLLIDEPYPRHPTEYQLSERYSAEVLRVQSLLRATLDDAPLDH